MGSNYASKLKVYLGLCQTFMIGHQRQPPEVFCKKGVLKSYAKFRGKHLCQSLFFNRVPVDTERKLNVHKTFRRHPGRFLNVLCTFSLRPVSTGVAGLRPTTLLKKENLAQVFSCEFCDVWQVLE